jgi:hypothetical protein
MAVMFFVEKYPKESSSIKITLLKPQFNFCEFAK